MEKTKSAFPLVLKYAIITGLASFIFSVITYITNLYLNQAVGWLGYVILLIGIIFGILERKRKDLNGFISFGQAFTVGFLIALFTSIIVIIGSYIMMNYIAPDMIDQILKMSEQKMIDKGMTDEQIKMGMDFTKRFMTPLWFSVTIIIFYCILGAIESLIAAAIMRKDNPNLQAPTA